MNSRVGGSQHEEAVTLGGDCRAGAPGPRTSKRNMAAGRFNLLVAVGGASRRFRAGEPFATAARGAQTASIATAGEPSARKTPTHLAAGGVGPRFIFLFDTLMSGRRRQSRRQCVAKRGGRRISTTHLSKGRPAHPLRPLPRARWISAPAPQDANRLLYFPLRQFYV